MTQADLRSDHRIIKRIIIQGNLVLETPTCLGNGDRDSLTDLALLRDSISNCALLTGASLAGALRNYLRERVSGFGQVEEKQCLVTQLFGSIQGEEEGDQSPLIVNDATSQKAPDVEFRDGVKIQSATGTAEDKAKYDLELLTAGTTFPLLFELLIEQKHNEIELKQALAIALQGLENGEIAIGMKKRRGFGRCKVSSWQGWEFDLQDPVQCRAWLHYEHWTPGLLPNITENSLGKPGSNITEILNIQTDLPDKREIFKLSATFTLEGALLIRAGQGTTGLAPDVVQLTSKRGAQNVPVISGTSWAGVLRHRAERILNTLNSNSTDTIIQSIFGNVQEGSQSETCSSRLVVDESTIKQAVGLVQTRIAIDRFTGGALHGALLQEQPIFGGNVILNLELRNPEGYEIGLLLLLLKDLWTGDLPIGGSSSVGRGRLQGKIATMNRYCSTPKGWKIEQSDDCQLIVTDLQTPSQSKDCVKQELEDFVKTLITYVAQEKKP
jgi:CRISPR/Cas system CSM-associated protein Csm3 (group 7 of RAMP superfamily)